MTETSLLPIALASFASFLFGVMQVSTKRGLAHTEPQTGALITIGTAAIIYGLAMPW